jgi:hypothetical protein
MDLDSILLILLVIGGAACVAGLVAALIAQTMARWAMAADAPAPGGFPVAVPTAVRAPVLRYAVLHHTGVATPHYDLMFETAAGSPLATWRSAVWPIAAPTPVERLDDHRSDYLAYEGPVSGDRGEVRRVAGGGFCFESDGDRWRLVLEDGSRLTLSKGSGAVWLAEVGQTG